jgi:hypothetical protein
MGHCSDKSAREKEPVVGKSARIATVVAVNKGHFQFHYVIGKGGFGKVWRVEKKKERSPFAMKEMNKARILSKRSVNSVLNERKILTMLRHPYVLPPPFPQSYRQHGLLLSGQGELVPRDGSDGGWRLALSPLSQAEVLGN